MCQVIFNLQIHIIYRAADANHGVTASLAHVVLCQCCIYAVPQALHYAAELDELDGTVVSIAEEVAVVTGSKG